MKKMTIVSITAVLLLACLSGFFIWKVNDDKEKKELALLADISNIQVKVNALYKDDTKMDLADHIDDTLIQESQNLLLNFTNKELSPEASTLLNQASADISYVEKMFSLKQSIASIFDDNGAIIESVDMESYKNQLNALKSDKTAFVNELIIKVNEADAQIEQISAATKMVDALFTSAEKSTVKESITQTELDAANAITTIIKQDKAKTNLLSDIKKADTYLDEKLKAEAAAKAKAEADAKAAAAAKAKAAAKKPSSGKSSSDETFDLTGWAPYDTDDAKLLLKYIASGDVVKYNGQYWASPQLINLLSNEEVVYFHDLADD